MNKEKKDNLIFGVMMALILPAITIAFFYMITFSDLAIDYWGYLAETNWFK